MLGILKFLKLVLEWASVLIPILICYLQWRRYKIEKQETKIMGPKKRIIIVTMVLAFVLIVFNLTQKCVNSKINDLTKRIPPRFNVYLAKTDKGNQVIVFDAINYTPFEAIWTLVTEENKVVDGIMLSPTRIFLNKQKKRIYYKVSPDEKGVKNNYLELRVHYNSIYSAELNEPAELVGMITKKYKYLNGEFSPLD